MKVGMLSQWFDPETGPAALPGVYAREMIRQGHDVSVLTGFPNYPLGHLYEGFIQAPRRTTIEHGARVTRVPLYPSHNASALGRIANYASFALSAASLGARSLADTDAIWVYNSPVSVALPLMTETFIGRKPYFLHVQDLWPDSLVNSKMLPAGRIGRLVARRVSSVVRVTEKHAARIGVISPSVRQLILDRHPSLDETKILYVPNPTDEHIFKPFTPLSSCQHSYPWNDSFSVMYLGAVGEAQGLDTLLDAAKLFRVNESVRIVIVGEGIAKRRLQRRAEDEQIRNVVFHERIPKEQVPEMMASAHVQLVSLAGDEFLRYTTPSKISSIMACGLPIIGHLSGDGAALIEKAGAGVSVMPGSARLLAAAIRQLYDLSAQVLASYGESGRRYYSENLSMEASTLKILSSLEASLY